MVLFDDTATVGFYLDTYTTNADVYNAIGNLGYSEDGTNIASGLNMAINQVVQSDHK